MSDLHRFLSHLDGRGIRLWVEADRLRFRAPAGALTDSLRAEIGTRKAEILELFEHEAGSGPPPVTPRSSQEPPPLSYAQQRLWLLDRLQGSSAHYNESSALEVRGALRIDALAVSLGRIVDRHEVLRTTFPQINGSPVQAVAPSVTVRMPIVDLEHLAAPTAAAVIERLSRAEALRPFDLAAGPLMRLTLVRRGVDLHVLLATLHHIVTDAWSGTVFARELAAGYEACLDGGGEPLGELDVQYADFAVWQRRWLEGEVMERQLRYWRRQLDGGPEQLELPADRPRPPVPSGRGGVVRRDLADGPVRRLERLAQASAATPFMGLLAVYAALLARLGRQREIHVGSPIANRVRPELEPLIGFFVNTLVLRVDTGGRATTRQLLERVKRVCLDAYAHQDVPFEQVVDALGIERSLSRTPLFQTMFVLENVPGGELRLPGLTLAPRAIMRPVAKFDLTLLVHETGSGLRADFEYSSDLFDASTVRRLAEHFSNLLAGAVAAPDRPVAEIALLAAAERHQLLSDWNDTRTAYPREATVHALFAARAAQTPDAVAVVLDGANGHLTYAGLDAEAGRLAGRLAAWGVGPESLVAICAERSTELVVGLLAILKAGAAYVPLDPAYPEERLAFMLEDAGARVVLTQTHLATRLPSIGARVVRLDARLEADVPLPPRIPDPPPGAAGRPTTSLAYVTYTSGSTGRPKGVAIPHRGVVRLLCETDYVDFDPGDVFLLLAPVTFDASTFEIWGALLHGARLAVTAPRAPSATELGSTLRRHRVSTLWLTAGLFHLMVDERLEDLTGVRQLLAGGEALSLSHVETARGRFAGRLIDGYGPTENSTFTTSFGVPREGSLGPSVPIGRPLANTEVVVMEPPLEPAPIGAPGELMTGGDGLARGYHKRPARTAESFVPHPFGTRPGRRVYRTGDLVRTRPAGQIEFLGRLDSQVKIRGLRIEPGEVEAVLTRLPQVRRAVVLARPAAPRRGAAEVQLVAFVVPDAGAAPPPDELKKSLARRLPDFMVPAVFVLLEAFPETPAGKVDRAALARRPLPEAAREARDEAPRTAIEEILAGLWTELLGTRSIARSDDFFALGGHSLLATRLIARVETAFGIEVPLRRVFETPTLAALGAAIDAERRRDLPPPPDLAPVPRATDAPLSFAQQRMWFLDRLEGPGAYDIAGSLRLEGALAVDLLASSLATIVRRHEVLRTRFPVVDGRPTQVIDEDPAVGLPEIDLQRLRPAARDAETRRLATQEGSWPFDLAAGPLLRTLLLRRGPRSFGLVLSMHHIVSDGWSLGILVHELSTLYGAAVSGRPAVLPALEIQYADFAVWQRRWLRGEVLERQLSYWRRQLAGLPELLELPTDRPRPAVQSFRGRNRLGRFGPDLAAALNQLSRRSGVTLFMTLVTGFASLLHRYSGQRDFALGTPIANRTRREVEPLIGFFVNTLVLRLDVSGRPSFASLLDRVRHTALDAYAHQDLPFEQLVEDLAPRRHLAHSPLFQVMFSLQNAPFGELLLPDVELAPMPIEGTVAKFDLTLAVEETETGIETLLEYNRDLFDGATVERVAGHLDNLLRAAVEDPTRPVSALPWVSPVERRQLLAWSAPEPDPRTADSLTQLFAARVVEQPDAVAVVFRSQALSFRALDAETDRLASRLRGHGAGRGSRVAIALERSAERLVAVLGALKAGAAYLPLDPDHPRARNARMLDEAGVEVLVASRSARALLPPFRGSVVRLDADRRAGSRAGDARAGAARPGPEDPAYLIYTSGSTGRPKGVVVPHRALVRHALAVSRRYGLEPSDRVLQFAPLTFDVAAEEIFPTLSIGATLVLWPTADRGPFDEMTRLLARERLTVLNLPVAYWHAWVRSLARCGEAPAPNLRLMVAGSEKVVPQQLDAWRAVAPRVAWHNAYGLTEATVTTTVHDPGPGAAGVTVPIGRPLAGSRAYVLDAELEPLPTGVPGELFIGGSGVATGYAGRPAATAERFVPDLLGGEAGGRLYRTGDLGRWLAGGELEFLGRRDHQVKVRGYRIEPGEIEAALDRHPAVTRSAVAAWPDEIAEGSSGAAGAGASGASRLVAYVVSPEPVPTEELRELLRQTLPEHMLPATFVHLDALPTTPAGKLDRRALPRPGGGRPDLRSTFVEPRTRTESRIAAIWRDVLGLESVGTRDNFFDLGGHSLLLIEVQSRLRESLDLEISIVDLFRYPTIRALTVRLEGPDEPLEVRCRRAPTAAAVKPRESQIAVVGMACRFPGADGVDAYWQMLANGTDGVTFFTDDELRDAGVDPDLLADGRYVKAKGFLDGIELFDAPFFGFSPAEAATMDPQHRLFLECAWEAFEHAGYRTDDHPGSIGVYAGVSMNTYLLENLYPARHRLPQVGEMQLAIGNDKDSLPTMVSYRMDLRGPSVNVQTACSTSLVAVHMACRSLLAGDCDLALAGGVSARVPARSGYLYDQGMIYSPDGRCRPFDARAGGTLAGDGVGAVVLKPLARALADGDQVHAVIRGSFANNDGAARVGFTAPGVDGQTAVIAGALADAGVDADTVSYVEAHGTATALGDPIEIEALTQAFRRSTAERGFCAVGSVKSNFGHLDAAAGIAGLIKTVMALRHRQIPPSLHFERPNPEIDFASSPFYVNVELRGWPAGATPRRAGVSSFGIGGSNAHVILEEPPPREPSGESRPDQVLVISARTPDALDAATVSLADHLEARPEDVLADVAYTVAVGRRPFAHRRALVCRSSGDALRALRGREPQRLLSRRSADAPPVAFLFPGQGSQHPGMAAGLYRAEAGFRHRVDRCCDLLEGELGLDLRRVLYPDTEGAGQAARALRQTRLAQPALFVVCWALAGLWRDWGVRPRAMLGHSVGELVAACLAGVLRLEDALSLVAARGRLLQALPGGAMLAVKLAPEELDGRLEPGAGVTLAAVNGPAQCVVSGPADGVETLQRKLAADGVVCRRLETSHAFHSAMVEPAVGPYTELLRRTRLEPPRIPFVSNVTGTWITDHEATSPEYWGRHLRRPVRFREGLETLGEDAGAVLLEVGPGRTLSGLALGRSGQAPKQTVVTSLPHRRDSGDDARALLRAVARLWLAGADVDWRGFYDGQRRHRLPLPTYPFERRRYWVDPKEPGESPGPRPADGGPAQARLFAPVWKQAAPAVAAGAPAGDRWLVLLDPAGVGARLARRLEELGKEVTTAAMAAGFERRGERAYALDPRRPEDYDALLDALGAPVDRIVHGWGLGNGDAGDEILERTFYSFLFLAQALGRRPAAEMELVALTDRLHDLAGTEAVVPEKAAVLGPVKVLPYELPGLRCRAIDVDPDPDAGVAAGLVERLLAELAGEPPERLIAYRRHHRWVRTFEPVEIDPAAPSRLREGGVYWITGGLGGIGLSLAEHLAREKQARLILTGRRGAGDVTERADAVRRLEDLGAEVLALAADVTDLVAMRRAKARAEQRFGRIHGVVHCAGVAGLGAVQVKTRAEARRVLAPKVEGARVLGRLFPAEDPDAQLDFLVLSSSLATLSGGPGLVDYCAANACLDAFAGARNARGAPTSSIGWDAWRDSGMALETPLPAELESWRRETLARAIPNAEGVRAFCRVLASGLPQVAVTADPDLTPEDLARGRSAEPDGPELGASADGDRTAPHPRPRLETPYAPPGSEVERALTRIWQQVLGVGEIGVHDNFFELGGHSLLATQVISRVREDLAIEPPVGLLFEAPTVADLAERIETELWAIRSLAAAGGATAEGEEQGEL